MKKVLDISMIDQLDNYWEFRKHSSIVQMSNLSTLLHRKITDVSLWMSKNQLKENINQRKFGCELGLFKRLVGFKDGNNELLKESFKDIRRTEYEYNIFNKDGSEDRGHLNYFSDVQIITGGRGKPSYVYWRYPDRILEAIKNPNMYVMLNLLILLDLDSKHSYALYSFLKDYVRLGRFNFSYQGIRYLFGVQEGQYYSFSMLKRRVLDVAVDEINEKTDLAVSYEVEKVGRTIMSIKFKMKLKKNKLQSMANNKEIAYKLKSLGIKDNQINELLKKHHEEYLLANIEAVEDRIKEGGSIKNKPAYLMSAFERDFRPLETEYFKVQKEKQAIAEEQKQIEHEEALRLQILKEQYTKERFTGFQELLEGFSENEYSDLKGEFENQILQTGFVGKIYKTKGFQYGAIQVKRRNFLIEKFLPSYLHSFENYVTWAGQEDNLSN